MYARIAKLGLLKHRTNIRSTQITRLPFLARSRCLLCTAGTAGLLLAGSGLSLAAPTYAAPPYQTRIFQVLSVGSGSLVVRGPLARVFTVAVDPSASLRRRFNGSFAFSSLAQIEPNDRIQMGFRVTSPGYLTAYLIQDYSLQIAHSEVKGLVTSVAPDYSSFTLSVTRAFGGSLAAFVPGQSVTVYTPNPASIPMTYAQGGPTCGTAACLAGGMYLELYGRSDHPNLNISNPQAIVQVASYAPLVVHAPAD